MSVSRRAFMVASGCGAANAVEPGRLVDSYGRRLTQEFIQSKGAQTARDIGCDPTGKSDCADLMENHLRAHGRLYIDKGVFRLSRPIFLASNQEIFGGGPESILWNDRSHENIAYHCVFMIGNHFSSALTASNLPAERYRGYAAKNARAGQRRIRLESRVSTDEFRVGELIFVSSSTYYTLGRNSVYEYLKLTEIVEISGEEFLLKDSFEEDLGSEALVWKIGGVDPLFKRDFFAIKNVKIHDLGIDAYSFAQRWSFYECNIWNLWLFNCTNGIVGNAATKSKIANINGTFSSRAIEIKTGANALVVENVRLMYRRDERVPAQVFVQTGEQAYNIHFVNVRIFCPEAPNASVRALELLGRNISFIGGHVARAGAIRESCVAVLSPNASQRWATKNIRIAGSTFECGFAATNYLKIGHSRDSSAPDAVVVGNNAWWGVPVQRSVWIDGGSLEFFDNKFNSPAAGLVGNGSVLFSELLPRIEILPRGGYIAKIPKECSSISILAGHGGRGDPVIIFLDGVAAPFVAMGAGIDVAITDLVLTVRNNSELKTVRVEAIFQSSVKLGLLSRP